MATAPPPRHEFRACRSFLLWHAAACFGAAAWLGGASWAFPERAGPAPIAALAFGVLGLWTARRARDRRPRIVMSEEGISVDIWLTDMIPWRDIRAVRFHFGFGNPALCVDLQDPARYGCAFTLTSEWVAKLTRHVGIGEASVPLEGLDAAPEAIVATAQAMWRRSREQASR